MAIQILQDIYLSLIGDNQSSSFTIEWAKFIKERPALSMGDYKPTRFVVRCDNGPTGASVIISTM
mgnify:CR=1 FL=1